MSVEKSSKNNVKKRSWAFIVYPTKEQLKKINSLYDGSDGYGTLPDDWKEILQLSGLKYAISPLHDKDLNADNTFKKPHYHVIVSYGSPTTFNNVKSLCDRLNAPIPQALEKVEGYFRYLTHQDNPDKYQYDKKDIVYGGGFNISDFVELSKSEITEIKSKLHTLIRELNIIEYGEFMDYVQNNFDNTVYEIASNNTIFFTAYIRSRRHSSLSTKNSKKCDVETGEVIE